MSTSGHDFFQSPKAPRKEDLKKLRDEVEHLDDIFKAIVNLKPETELTKKIKIIYEKEFTPNVMPDSRKFLESLESLKDILSKIADLFRKECKARNISSLASLNKSYSSPTSSPSMTKPNAGDRDLIITGYFLQYILGQEASSFDAKKSTKSNMEEQQNVAIEVTKEQGALSGLFNKYTDGFNIFDFEKEHLKLEGQKRPLELTELDRARMVFISNMKEETESEALKRTSSYRDRHK